MFGLPVASKVGSPRFMNFGLSLMMEFAKVHPYAWVQISDDFIRETFHTHFFNAREVIITFLGRISVNVIVQWLDVPQPFGETVIANVAWTGNIYVNL